MKSHPNHFSFSRITLLIVAVVTLLFTSCQEDEGFVSDNNTLKSSTLLDNTGYVTFYEKELFVRMEGKPVTMTRQIGNSSMSNFEPCYLVYVQSGYENANYVSSAVVKIDGIELLNTSDFSNTNSLYQFELCNLTETSTIELVIMGAPGSTLEVWIEGKKKNIDIVTDIEGNIYKTVKIGEQWWMAENLRSKHFLNGDVIPTSPIDPDIPSHCNEFEPIYQWPVNGDENMVNTFGRLYTWYATMDSRKICPTGWHIPTGEEWGQLIEYVGYSVGELKSTGTIEEGDGLWVSPNVCATNSTGLSIVPTGIKTDYWRWPSPYELSAFWLPAETPLPYAPTMPITNWNCTFNSSIWPPCYGLSIRCIKD